MIPNTCHLPCAKASCQCAAYLQEYHKRNVCRRASPPPTIAVAQRMCNAWHMLTVPLTDCNPFFSLKPSVHPAPSHSVFYGLLRLHHPAHFTSARPRKKLPQRKGRRTTDRRRASEIFSPVPIVKPNRVCEATSQKDGSCPGPELRSEKGFYLRNRKSQC